MTIPFGLKTVINFLIGLISFLFISLPSYAQDPMEVDYNNLAQQMVRQFWSEMQVKLSLLPNNYITDDDSNFRTFRGTSGCPHSNGKEATLATIDHTKTTKNGELSFQFTYTGCNKKELFQELISVKDPKNQFPLTTGDLLSGERNFIANASNPQIIHSYYDGSGKSLLQVESHFNSLKRTTSFYAFDTLLAEISIHKNEKLLQVRVFSYKFNYKSPLGGKMSGTVTHSANPVIHQTEYLANDIKKYAYIGSSFNEQSESSFNNYFSLVALTDLKNIMGNLILMLNSYFPTTESSTGGLANKRLLNELIVLDQKLNIATPADITFVQTRLKSYIKAIEDGTLTIIDKRPE